MYVHIDFVYPIKSYFSTSSSTTCLSRIFISFISNLSHHQFFILLLETLFQMNLFLQSLAIQNRLLSFLETLSSVLVSPTPLLTDFSLHSLVFSPIDHSSFLLSLFRSYYPWNESIPNHSVQSFPLIIIMKFQQTSNNLIPKRYGTFVLTLPEQKQ